MFTNCSSIQNIVNPGCSQEGNGCWKCNIATHLFSCSFVSSCKIDHSSQNMLVSMLVGYWASTISLQNQANFWSVPWWHGGFPCRVSLLNPISPGRGQFWPHCTVKHHRDINSKNNLDSLKNIFKNLLFWDLGHFCPFKFDFHNFKNWKLK